MNSYGNSFSARYAGECADCNNQIEPGQMARYRYPEKVLCHLKCSPSEPAESAPYTLSGGSGYGCHGWHKGQIVRVKPDRYEGHEYLYVVSASSRYVREEGMSFGVGDEQGHLYTAKCRAATETESAPLRAEIADRKDRQNATKRKEEIAVKIQAEGDLPEGIYEPQGKRLLDTQNLYGGGDWFVVGADYIWYIRNNGADGDDWSRNNVRTGGAGAIGWRVPLNPGWASDLEAIAEILK